MFDCPFCETSAPTSNDLCELHKTEFEIKPVVIFGRKMGFGIFSDKFMNGDFPIHINLYENQCADFFYTKGNIEKLRQAITDQKSLY